MASQDQSGTLWFNIYLRFIICYCFFYECILYVDQAVKYKPRKATRGMATSKIARAALTRKLSVTFDDNCRQPICSNAERFNNEIGFIV